LLIADLTAEDGRQKTEHGTKKRRAQNGIESTEEAGEN
jgi:hypothetical protein